MRAIIAAAVGMITLTSLSHADEAFHCPKPGTVVTLNVITVTFTGQSGFVCTARSSDGRSVGRFLGLDSTESNLAKNHGERLFPLRSETRSRMRRRRPRTTRQAFLPE